MKSNTLSPYIFPGIKREDLITAGFPHLISKHPVYTKEEVMEIVSQECGVTIEQIVSRRRFRFIVEARQILAKVLKDKCRMTFANIGKTIGDRDHTTAIHSVLSYDNLYTTDDSFREKADNINYKLGIRKRG
jgi:chromosomal replication initiator protein